MTGTREAGVRRSVLFVHATAERYGSDRSLLRLAVGLARRGWHVVVAVGVDGPLVSDLRAAGVEVAITPVGAFRRVFTRRQMLRFVVTELPTSIWRVRRLARLADVVHLNTSIVLGAAIGARAARRPVVWHVRESYADHARTASVYRRVIDLLATAIVANSAATGRELLPRRRRPIVVVPNGMEFGELPVVPLDRTGIVSVGRINAWKGHEVLVDAVAVLRARGVDVAVEIAGDVYPGGEQYRDRLEQRISAHRLGGYVRLLGFVDDVPALLRRNGVFVLASTRPEPFGLALVEAMADGLACIATDAGGPAEIVRAGVTGLLVPPGDVTALADGIERLLRDARLRSALGAAAAADVRDRYGIDSMVTGIEAVYRSVLDGSVA